MGKLIGSSWKTGMSLGIQKNTQILIWQWNSTQTDMKNNTCVF